MRTIHRRKHGKSLLKRATGLNPPCARDSSERLVKLTMILLHARNNAHGKQVIPAKLVMIELEVTKNGQNEDPDRTGRIHPDKGMMRMDGRGMERALIARITTIPLNPTGNELARPEIFTNTLIRMMNSMRGTTSSTICPDGLARRQRRA